MSAKPVLFGLYGIGGAAREIMPLAKRNMEARFGNDAECIYVQTAPEAGEVNGTKVLSEADFLALKAQKHFNIAIADSKIRQALAEKCVVAGCLPFEIRAADFLNFDGVEIGIGAILCPRTTITCNIRIGQFFHANIYSYVTHDCVIGDYVTFAPRVNCNGNVHIGDHAYIGTGAILRQGKPGQPLIIGEGAVVGMGAVVTKDVAPYTTVVGNPVRVLSK
ncbi:MAG TPA: acetyltransferase [Alphaproteobacteria bacterium]|nr:acetyltransferase [Alphaproteobacteria bacterium]